MKLDISLIKVEGVGGQQRQESIGMGDVKQRMSRGGWGRKWGPG